jgi:hypothetical protein
MPYKDKIKRIECHRLSILKHRDTRQKGQANKRLRMKLTVLTHYGNGKCACIGCGFSDIRALSIDHINGDGAQHRRESSTIHSKLYYWLIKHNLPEGYQTLCMNCQFIKRASNYEFVHPLTLQERDDTLPLFPELNNKGELNANSNT